MRAVTDRHEPIVQGGVRPKGEKRRSNGSLWLFVGLVLLALLTIPFLLLRPRVQTYTLRSYTTATVTRGTLVDWVRGTGTVVPRLERSVLAPAEGTLAEWLVAEGDEVAQGTPLGRLSSKALADALADAEGEVQTASLALDKVMLDGEATTREAASALKRAQSALETAQEEWITAERLFGAGRGLAYRAGDCAAAFGRGARGGGEPNRPPE